MSPDPSWYRLDRFSRDLFVLAGSVERNPYADLIIRVETKGISQLRFTERFELVKKFSSFSELYAIEA